MNAKANRFQLLGLMSLLLTATAACYWPVLSHGFLNYDDPDYITSNEVVQKGLTKSGIQWAFTTSHASNWHPVTWLSHMLDVTLFGLAPQGHHATNLLLHLANTLLLLLLLRQLTGSTWRSGLVAALFALHPLHVESVAWMAERKDVLSAFFGLLCLMAYTRYVKEPRSQGLRTKSWYGITLLLFALGLMSKPMLVTWPFVMLLLDFWPLQRIKATASLTPRLGTAVTGAPSDVAEKCESTGPAQKWPQLVVEKVPFLILGITSCIITLKVQEGAMAKGEIISLGERAGNAILAYTDYLQQTVWPTKLAVFYPFPVTLPLGKLAVAAAIVAAISAVAIHRRRTQPFMLMGWLWFLGTLVPVIGLVQVGAQARADRYTYLPLIGIFIVLSWGLHGLLKQRLPLKLFGLAAVVATLIALGLASQRQLEFWKDDRALCAHAAKVTTHNYMAWGGLGIVEVKAGDWPSAMTNLLRAYEYAKLHHTERSVSYYVGVALQMQGKPKEALPYLEDCVVSAEMEPERNHRLGLSLMDAGRMAEAEAAIKRALAAKPQVLDYNLGMAALLMAKGATGQAELIYTEALTQHSQEAAAYKAYGDFLMLAKRPMEAEPRYATAVSLKPDAAPYHKAYANSLEQNGRAALAAEQYEKAFTLAKPASQELLDLADIYAQLGQPRKVLVSYNRAIEQEPHFIPALNNLAWLLATCPEDEIRNGTRAVELAEQACQLANWNAAVLMGTLAAAYAEAGRFSDAITMANKAIANARAASQEDIAKRNGELLEFYRRGKPYREK